MFPRHLDSLYSNPYTDPVLNPHTLGSDCEGPPSSDAIQRAQNERLLAEGTSQIGMPAIKNFRERKMLKDILANVDYAIWI